MRSAVDSRRGLLGEKAIGRARALGSLALPIVHGAGDPCTDYQSPKERGGNFEPQRLTGTASRYVIPVMLYEEPNK